MFIFITETFVYVGFIIEDTFGISSDVSGLAFAFAALDLCGRTETCADIVRTLFGVG